MKILNWYITKSFFSTFLMAISILTFGMTGAQLMKAFDYLSQGIPVSLVGEFLLYTLPMALAFTIPWASLVSIMLVFGRMSADNEITAMRACGVSILQIIAPIILSTFCLTCLCLYLQLEVGPWALGRARSLLKTVVVNHPTALFTPGIPVEVENLSVYIDAKDNNNNIFDIQLYVLDDDNSIRQDITASRGKIETDPASQIMKIILYDAVGSSREGGGTDPRFVHLFGREVVFYIEYGKKFNSSEISRRDKYLTFRELFARSMIEKRQGVDTTRLEVELNQRVALALAPIAFMMLGMPLAIRTSRRETSIGLFLSVLLSAAYFGGVLISDALRNHTEFFPQHVVWVPPILFQGFGIYYLLRIARK